MTTPMVDRARGSSDVSVEDMDKLELIWQMGQPTLHDGIHEFRVPQAVSVTLTDREIHHLMTRLSKAINGTPTTAYFDKELKVLRIVGVTDMPKIAPGLASELSTPSAITSPAPSVRSENHLVVAKNRPYGKKQKIPRPPNAFILYRQKYHPLLKKHNPEMHNNDISVILGKQWKEESSAVKQKYKALAEEAKRQHHLKHPNYAYSPRKPGEKPRRMSERKRSLQALDQAMSIDDEQGSLPFDPATLDVENILGIMRPDEANNLRIDLRDTNADLIVTLPHNDDSAQGQVNAFNAGIRYRENLGQSGQPDIFATPSTRMPNHIAQTNNFMNAVIDWDAIRDGVNNINASINTTEGDESAELQDADPYIAGFTDDEYETLQRELARATELFR